MPRIVIFDEVASPQRVIQITGPSVNEGPYHTSGRTDFVVHPDLSLLATLDADGRIATYIVPKKYWKHVAGAIVEYTAGEKTTQDTADAAQDAINEQAQLDDIRDRAAVGLDDFEVNSLLLRAFADIVKDEINILRALHSLPDRTLAQLRTSIVNKVNSGDVDS